MSFRSLKSLTPDSIKRFKIRLKLGSIRTNILFVESEDKCTNL